MTIFLSFPTNILDHRITLAWLSTLCVLTKPYIFPGATTDGSINDGSSFYLKLYFWSTLELIKSLSRRIIQMARDQSLRKNFFLIRN